MTLSQALEAATRFFQAEPAARTLTVELGDSVFAGMFVAIGRDTVGSFPIRISPDLAIAEAAAARFAEQN
jgi:hypothetical protein